MFGPRRSSISSTISSHSTVSQTPLAPQLNLSVSVFARIRPSLPSDTSTYDTTLENQITSYSSLLQAFPDENAIIVARSHADTAPQRFVLDGIFSSSSSQREVHRRSGTLLAVEEVLSGSNAVVLVYGQTGSGKTFTVFGPPSSGGLEAVGARDASLLGLLPRALHDVFEKTEVKRSSSSNGSLKIDISIRYLQLYNDTWIDLLDVSGVDRGGGDRSTNIHADTKLTPSTASLHPCADVRIALQLLHRGDRRKVVAATSMNSTSSRGHTLFQIVLRQEEKHSPISIQSTVLSTTTLSFLDLAGSERISKSNAEGLQLTEAKNINKSLHGLSVCLSAVANSVLKQQQQLFSGNILLSNETLSSSFIPWRTSRLTRFLQSCLAEPLPSYSSSLPSVCRKCLLELIVCVSPSDSSSYESLSTLSFAARARAVTVALAGDYSAARAALSDTTYIIGTSKVRKNASSSVNSEGEGYSSRPPSNDGSDADNDDNVSTSTRGGGGGEILGKVLDQQRTQIGSLTLSYETLLAANKQLQSKLEAAEAEAKKLREITADVEAKKLREIKEKIESEASASRQTVAHDRFSSQDMSNLSKANVNVNTNTLENYETDIVIKSTTVESKESDLAVKLSTSSIPSSTDTESLDISTNIAEKSKVSLQKQCDKLNESNDLESILASALASGSLDALRSAVEHVASVTLPVFTSIDATPKQSRNSLSLEELSSLPITPMLSLPTPTSNSSESISINDQPAAGARSSSRSRPSHDNAWKKSLRGDSSSPYKKSSLPPPSPNKSFTPQSLLQLAGMKSPSSRSLSASKINRESSSSSSGSSGTKLPTSKKSSSPAPLSSLVSMSPNLPSLEMLLSPMPPQSSHSLNSGPSPSEEVFSLAARGGMREQLSNARTFIAVNGLLKSPEGGYESSDLLDIPLSPEEQTESTVLTALSPAAASPPPPPPPPPSTQLLSMKAEPVSTSGAFFTSHHRSSLLKNTSNVGQVKAPSTPVSSGSSGDPGVAIAAVQAALNRAQGVLTRLQNQQHGLHLPHSQNRPLLASAPLPSVPFPSVPSSVPPPSFTLLPQHQSLHQQVKEEIVHLQTAALHSIAIDSEKKIEKEDKLKESLSSSLEPLIDNTPSTDNMNEVIEKDLVITIVKEDVVESKYSINKVNKSSSITRDESNTNTNTVSENKSATTEEVNNSKEVENDQSQQLNRPEEILKIDESQNLNPVILSTQEVRMVAAEVAGSLAAKALEAMQAQIEKQQEQLAALQLQQEQLLKEREERNFSAPIYPIQPSPSPSPPLLPFLEPVVEPVLSVTQASKESSLPLTSIAKNEETINNKNNEKKNEFVEEKEEEEEVKAVTVPVPVPDKIEENNDKDDESDDIAPALSGALTLTAAAEAAVVAMNQSALSRSRRSSFGAISDSHVFSSSTIDVTSALQNARAALARALSAVSDTADDEFDELYHQSVVDPSGDKATISAISFEPHTISSSTLSANFILESHSTPSIQETLPVKQGKPALAAGVAGTNVVRALHGQRTSLFDSQILGSNVPTNVPTNMSTNVSSSSSSSSTITTNLNSTITASQSHYMSASSASLSANKAAAEAVAAAAAIALTRENAERESAQLQHRSRTDQSTFISPLVHTVSKTTTTTPSSGVILTPPPIRAARDTENRSTGNTLTGKVESQIDSDTVSVFVPGQGIVVMSKAKLAAMHVPVDTSKRAHIDDQGNLNVTSHFDDQSLVENLNSVPLTNRPDLRSTKPLPQPLVSKRFG